MAGTPSAPHHGRHDEGGDSATERWQAAAAFCAAAAALDAARRSGDDVLVHQHDAADALVALCDLGASRALAEALRPDPEVEPVVWTVACYQIGDLIPCDLQDFNDAMDAIGVLANCAEPSHAASELIASTGTGLRWTALVRAGDRVSFQLVSEESASSGSSAPSGALDAAIEHWGVRLAHWSASDGAEALGERADEVAPTIAGSVEMVLVELVSALHGVETALARQDGRVAELISRLEAIERRLGLLRTADADETGVRDAGFAVASDRGETSPAATVGPRV